MTAPRAFISHSHEDRTVAETLSASLRALGVDAWLDKWEIKPGDSIVQKVFEEGLKDCNVFVILLSPASVASAWVRTELDAAIVQRIAGATRVVPVVAAACEVPIALRALFRLDLSGGADGVARSLADVAFGRDQKPPVRAPPSSFDVQVPGLSHYAAALAVHMSGAMDEPDGGPRAFTATELANALELDAERLNGAVDELESLGLAHTLKWMGTAPYSFGQVEPTPSLAIHLRGTGALSYDPEDDVRQVAVAVVHRRQVDGDELVAATKLPPARINRAVSYLEDYGLVRVLIAMGTAPYSFLLVHATPATNRFVSQHCK